MKVHGEAVDLQRLDDLIERADSRNYTQGIDAAKIFTMLRSEKVAQHTTPWVWPLTVIVVSIGCGAL
jgi:glutaredoxin 2